MINTFKWVTMPSYRMYESSAKCVAILLDMAASSKKPYKEKKQMEGN